MQKRYNGRELDVDRSIYSLKKKGCFIGMGLDKKTKQHVKIIDVEKAKNLGNKSWGLIDFLVNWNGYFLQK